MTDKLARLKTIILVDDNKATYHLTQKIFEEFVPHVEVVWLSGGEEFIRFLDQGVKLDPGSVLVLMDVHMPGRCADEILADIHERGLGGRLPIVVMSAVQKPQDEIIYGRFPGVSFVVKPCGLDEYTRFIDALPSYLNALP